MSVPKVILHLGLPKTATSSLQHNVFQKLHDDGKINFLGKCLKYDYSTGRVKVYNYSGRFIRDAAEETISIDDARELLISKLNPELLNIFSDEGIMVAYPGKENLTLTKKFENLRVLLHGYDVQVVVTIRNPIDYLYSLYVELYPDYFSKVKELNSIEKYIEHLISNPNDVLFDSFFYSRWMRDLQGKFQVVVLQYECLEYGASSIYKDWGDMLGITEEHFSELFNIRRVNEKKKEGKEVKRLRDFRIIENKIRNALNKNGFLFYALRWIYNHFGIKKILSYRFSTKKTHKYPTENQCKTLEAMFFLKTKS